MYAWIDIYITGGLVIKEKGERMKISIYIHKFILLVRN
jgi:hypothetical protein